jgi:hypothetical protein
MVLAPDELKPPKSPPRLIVVTPLVDSPHQVESNPGLPPISAPGKGRERQKGLGKTEKQKQNMENPCKKKQNSPETEGNGTKRGKKK